MVLSTTEYSKSSFLNVHCWQGARQPLVPWESHVRLSLWSECSQKLALCPSCTGCWGVSAPCRVHFQDTKITTKARALGFYGIKAWSINNKQGKALSGSNKSCTWKGIAVRVASAGTCRQNVRDSLWWGNRAWWPPWCVLEEGFKALGRTNAEVLTQTLVSCLRNCKEARAARANDRGRKEVRGVAKGQGMRGLARDAVTHWAAAGAWEEREQHWVKQFKSSFCRQSAHKCDRRVSKRPRRPQADCH